MATAVAPREAGILDRISDFCDDKTKYVHRWVKDLSMWVTTISDYAEVTLVDRDVVDLGSLVSGLKLFDGAFDIAAVVPDIRNVTRQVEEGSARDVSRAAATSLTSMCKSALWLDKLDAIDLGSLASSLTITKCSTTIYTMGSNSLANISSLFQARSRDIAETGRQERLNTLGDTKQFYSLIRNVSIVALSVFALMAELAILPIIPIVMLTFSTISLIGTTGGFMAAADISEIREGQTA